MHACKAGQGGARPYFLKSQQKHALQEIIELSCVIVDTAACAVRPGGWQRYVKPDQHPLLTDFCTQLTGITQAQ